MQVVLRLLNKLSIKTLYAVQRGHAWLGTAGRSGEEFDKKMTELDDGA